MQNTINSQIEYIRNDYSYMPVSCGSCPKKNTSACDNCGRKRTESKSDCNRCDDKPKHKCGCEDKKDPCKNKRSVCSIGNYFAVQNYFSELVHDWEKELAKYNLGIQELENINYFTEQSENGELLNKVQFIFRKGHELITREFLVAPKGEKGDKLTWDDLTEGQKNALKGDKGDKGDDGQTPVLGFVKITYSESPCDISGYFERYEQTNTYDLILTLPKQRTFDECLEDIRNLINQFNINFESQLAQITQKVNSLENFDFCKLGLKLRNGNELSLTYNGLISNPVILDLPKQSEYTLKYFANGTDMWKDYIALMKDGAKEGDIFSPEKYRPKDWWILSYPGVILLQDGELITDRLRVSAWFKAEDKTYSESGVQDKNFSIYIQTTSSWIFTEETQEYDNLTWTGLMHTYNKDTGILTLPKNNSTAVITETVNGVQVTKNVQYRYRSGDFLVVGLWATDHLPRRIMIPIIDVSSYTKSQDIFFVDINPKYISNNISQALINYTQTWEFDLRNQNFYDINGNKINAIINVKPSVVIYKNVNGKKYFLGNYTIVSSGSESYTPTTSTMEINKFRLVEIKHSGAGTKEIGLVFKYLDNGQLKDLTENQHAAFYNYFISNINQKFLKPIRFRRKRNVEYVDPIICNYDSTREIGTIYFSYFNSDINDVIIQGNSNDRDFITNYDLYVKSSEVPENYYVWLDIIAVNSSTNIILQQPLNNQDYGIYTDVFNQNVMDPITDTITITNNIPQNVSAPNGVVCANGMFFNDGLFIATSQLSGTPTISEDGEYAYVDNGTTIQIQNLTKDVKEVKIGNNTYQVSPHAFIEETPERGETVVP